MSLSSSDILDAYRADLSNASKTQFSDRDATWLAVGTVLQRAVGLPARERSAYLQSARSAIADVSHGEALDRSLAALARDASSPDALCAVVTMFAEEAEAVGAYALATAMLDYARVLVGLKEFRLQGRLLSLQARIMRKIGDDDVAHELLDQVMELGKAHGDPELVARSHLGKGVLARIRGNYPAARREYHAVLEIPPSSDAVREQHVYAHHGLLVVSAIGRDFDAALKHGSLAVAWATDQQRLELLQNLSAVCFDVGQYRSALNGYLRVLAGAATPHVRIGCFGGAAAAAARLGDESTVKALVAAATPLLRGGGPEYELADMAREFAEAFGHLSDVEQWQQYRNDALSRAKRGKFFEIVHLIESMQRPRRPTPPAAVALTEDALAVTADLASGDSEQLLAAAVSSDPRDWHSR